MSDSAIHVIIAVAKDSGEVIAITPHGAYEIGVIR